jgi:hypothetical protein
MRLRSAVDDAQFVVVRAPTGDHPVTCGGHALAPLDAEGAEQPALAGHDDGTAIGKRYTDPKIGLELLCTKPGSGSLAVGDQILQLKSAQALPASD